MYPAAVGHQCPECVKEARQEFHRPARRPTASTGRGLTLTNLILLSLIGVYVLEVAAGGPSSLVGGPTTPTLVRLGANVGLFQTRGEIVGVATGEWWRLISAMFLHAGLLHIAFNGYALYIVGGVVEQELGRWRFAVLYAVTGFCASVASYAIGAPLVPSVGASGAIFGLFGVFFAYNYQRRHLVFYAARMRSMGTLILINLVLTFTFPGIDWRGHLGGLTTGIIGGLAVDGFGRRTSRTQVFVATMVALALLAVAVTVWRTAVIRSQFPQVFG
ncbi:MAG: rhomboid family intramembrane serine protease [Actinobacteria bacterium]|nr:MAG: rhomboid family intramembrane serine protease [Actinomycetota bacterium]